MRTPLLMLLFTACLAQAACAGLRAPRCAGGARPAVQELIYFGTQSPRGAVSAVDWADFLATTVTPRFPDGLTAWTASGQWRSASGEIVHEASWVLSLVHPAKREVDASIEEIVQAYKSRFEQEAVLRIQSNACMSL